MNHNNLKYYRKKRGYSQSKLAELVSIPQTTLSGWETGLQNGHSILKALALAQVFDCNVEDIFGTRQLQLRGNTKEPESKSG